MSLIQAANADAKFTVHKEFVSAKVAGETASLRNPALDRICDFSGKVGLVVIIHNDMDTPFAKPGSEPVYLDQMISLLSKHPGTTVILAQTGGPTGAGGMRQFWNEC